MRPVTFIEKSSDYSRRQPMVRELCITSNTFKTIGFPQFQGSRVGHFKKVHYFFIDGKNCRVLQRSRPDKAFSKPFERLMVVSNVEALSILGMTKGQTISMGKDLQVSREK
jgi:hypothetical protein